MGVVSLEQIKRTCENEIKNLTFIIEERRARGFSAYGLSRDIKLKKHYVDLFNMANGMIKIFGVRNKYIIKKERDVLLKEVLASLSGEGIFYSDEKNKVELQKIPELRKECGLDGGVNYGKSYKDR